MKSFKFLLLIIFMCFGCGEMEVTPTANFEPLEAPDLYVIDPYDTPLLDKVMYQYGEERNRGYTLSFSYNSNNKIAWVQHSQNISAKFVYDDFGKLVEINYITADNAGNHSITFEYEGDRIISSTDIYPDLLSFGLNSNTDYIYNDEGLPVEISIVYSQGQNESTTRTEIDWLSGKPINMIVYRDGVLALEQNLRYDRNKNSFRGNPYYFGKLEYWSSTNPVRSLISDYSGTYDVNNGDCIDCYTDYVFNENGLAKSIVRDNEDLELVYK